VGNPPSHEEPDHREGRVQDVEAVGPEDGEGDGQNGQAADDDDVAERGFPGMEGIALPGGEPDPFDQRRDETDQERGTESSRPRLPGLPDSRFQIPHSRLRSKRSFTRQ
jgi:hypothetical protein